MRPIDADALKIHVCDMCDDGQRECKGDESCAILCWINDMPTIESEVLLIPKEVSATDIDKLTEMIKDSLLQAYPNDAMFTAVRHGRWIRNAMGEGYHCSNCGHHVDSPIGEMIDPRDYKYFLDRHCGGCGARMDATDTNVGR